MTSWYDWSTVFLLFKILRQSTWNWLQWHLKYKVFPVLNNAFNYPKICVPSKSDLYPQMLNPRGTCTPKSKCEWECCIGVCVVIRSNMICLYDVDKKYMDCNLNLRNSPTLHLQGYVWTVSTMFSIHLAVLDNFQMLGHVYFHFWLTTVTVDDLQYSLSVQTCICWKRHFYQVKQL